MSGLVTTSRASLGSALIAFALTFAASVSAVSPALSLAADGGLGQPVPHPKNCGTCWERPAPDPVAPDPGAQ